MKLIKTEPISPKIDPYYYSLKEDRKDDDEVNFFINSTHPLKQDEIEKLKNEGCSRVSPIVDNISTASAKLGAIPNIAALDFITYLEMARQMYMDQE